MSYLRKSWHWYWIPTTVSMIGILSIILLVGIDRIRERQGVTSRTLDMIMHAEIKTATYHLWLEQAIASDASIDVKKTLTELDEAIDLISSVSGHEDPSSKDPKAGPAEEANIKAGADELQLQLVQFRKMGLERLEKPEISGIGTAADERFDAFFKEILAKMAVMEQMLETRRAAARTESRRLYWVILVSWMFVVVGAVAGLRNLEMQRKTAEGALLTANNKLHSHAEELTAHRSRLSELVKERTFELTAANELLRSEIADRREAENQVRNLTDRLLSAQETERKRISMELHDALGQALTVLKMELRGIERRLKTDQGDVREDCRNLLAYIDHTVEDVRRISLDLSPAILDDLGLMSSLQSLAGNFQKISAMDVNCEIADVDQLIARSRWITIYRVIQEAMTNIGKHATAEHMMLLVRCDKDNVIFNIEDDGKGFDTKDVSTKDAPQKGLGLMTMKERVGMLGGALEVWSEKGKGTRITFSIPVEQWAAE